MGLLSKLDLTKKLDSKDDYRDKLQKYQLELLYFQRRILESKRSIVLVFEGPDAAGKGGVIKRITEKLDPRVVRVYSITKPTPEEYQHHYMWRFWTRLPPHGNLVIFDRSWYGRILVERIEGFATQKEWKRAFVEINEFERQLVDDGSILMKFYVHVSKDEQLRRFKERQADPYKHWKINSEDWRNRKKWDEYLDAAEDMFDLTSPKYCPWHVISGEYKWYARVATLKHITKRLEEEFGKPKLKL
jgi:polyphosphate kinase 2 (PPK2 family)